MFGKYNNMNDTPQTDIKYNPQDTPEVNAVLDLPSSKDDQLDLVSVARRLERQRNQWRAMAEELAKEHLVSQDMFQKIWNAWCVVVSNGGGAMQRHVEPVIKTVLKDVRRTKTILARFNSLSQQQKGNE